MMANRLCRWERWEGFDKARDPVAESIIPLRQNGKRNWEALSDEELLAHAKWRLERNGIISRTKLARADPGLYDTLGNRRLMDGFGLADLRGNTRKWAGMDDGALMALAKRFISENGITRSKELKDADEGLYLVLGRRHLRAEFGLSNGRREWAGMGREGLVRHARETIVEKGILSRWGLQKSDAGLFSALRRMNLLDEIFSDADTSKHKDAVDGVLDALDSFGDPK